jgi:hydrogenase maturation protease
MAKTLIIGYGNPLRSDDGLGRLVAERLMGVLRESESRVIACHQLAPELAEPISRADLVIFIDAEERQPAGKLFCRRIAPVAEPPAAFSHHLTPARLLGWAGALFGRSPEAMVFSIAVENFALGEKLSPAAAKVLPQVTERICELVRRREMREAGKSKPAGAAE